MAYQHDAIADYDEVEEKKVTVDLPEQVYLDSMNQEKVIDNIGHLLGLGVNPNLIFAKTASNRNFVKIAPRLYKAGVKAEDIVSALSPARLAEVIDDLLVAGVDPQLLAGRLTQGRQIDNATLAHALDALVDEGVSLAELFHGLSANFILENEGYFLERGIPQVEIDDVRGRYRLRNYAPAEVHQRFEEFLVRDAFDPNALARKLAKRDVVDHVELLLEYGADPTLVASRMLVRDVITYLDVLEDYGAEIDYAALFSKAVALGVKLDEETTCRLQMEMDAVSES